MECEKLNKLNKKVEILIRIIIGTIIAILIIRHYSITQRADY